MKKILPMDMTPLIRTLPSTANYLGILNAWKYDTINILINHYIDLFYAKGQVNFIQEDYIRCEKFERIPFKFSENNIINNIKKEIDNNHYLLLILNEFSIQDEKIHTGYLRYHDWLIYGYDDDLSIFKIAGYYGPNTSLRVYGSADLSYIDLKNAALSALIEDHQYKNTDIDNHALWIKETNIEEIINIKRLKKSLKRYITSNLITYEKQAFAFNGKNIIKLLILELRFTKKNFIKFDLRNYRCCLENREIILIVLKHYSLELAEQYELNVIKYFNRTFYCLVKYLIKPNQHIIHNVVSMLSNIQQQEKNILKKLIKLIDG